jgi:biopolymer transport protein ExbD
MTWRSSDRLSGGDLAEINVAPLMDMVFILLIFFVVTSTFTRDTGVPVERPRAATSETLAAQNFMVTLSAEGKLFVQGRETSLEVMRSLLREELTRDPERTVVLLADGRSRHADLVSVLDACRQVGARHLSLATEHP